MSAANYLTVFFFRFVFYRRSNIVDLALDIDGVGKAKLAQQGATGMQVQNNAQ